jgi:hypothetical protein
MPNENCRRSPQPAALVWLDTTTTPMVASALTLLELHFPLRQRRRAAGLLLEESPDETARDL